MLEYVCEIQYHAYHPVRGFLGLLSMNGPLGFGLFLIFGFPRIPPRASLGVLARSLSTTGELLV